MPYRFATEAPNYSDLASGRVFYSLAGQPAFPIRLASEIFQRCLALRQKNGLSGRGVLYDPCCGAGYLISLLGYLHRAEIRAVLGSDINPAAVAVAERNLELLHEAGLKRRMAEIAELARRYGKESHRQALQSCLVIREHLRQTTERFPLATRAFQADAFDGQALSQGLNGAQVDLVLTDVPYGLHSVWQGAHSGEAVWALLDALQGVLVPGGLVAAAADKQQKVAHDRYQRLERFQVGKRKVTILKYS
jgi:tRNA G10  N-methylase Trm11